MTIWKEVELLTRGSVADVKEMRMTKLRNCGPVGCGQAVGVTSDDQAKKWLAHNSCNMNPRRERSGKFTKIRH